jgi:putative transposase
MVLMSKLRLPQEQIKVVLSELSAGRTVRQVSRKHGISAKTLYRWRAQFANGQQPDDKERLHLLETEHRRLKKQFAELTLDYAALRAALVGDMRGDC